MPRVKGVISILYGADDDDLVGLKNAVLTWTTDSIAAANVADLGWKNSVPNMSAWTVSASANALTTADGSFNAVQAAFEEMAFSKTEFAAKFTAENGAVYFGSCFVSSYRNVSADQAVFGFSVEMRGTGILIEVGGTDENLDWLPCWSGYWQIYGSQHPHYLGYTEGWVRYSYVDGAPGDLVIKDGAGITVHSVVGWGPGYTTETFFYWDRLPGDNPTVLSWVTTYGIPLYPAQIAQICGPGVYEPTT